MATADRLTTPTTPTTLKLGPADHGRTVSAKALDRAEYLPGFKYEVIAGRLYVSLEPNLLEHRLERWLRRALERYADDHPEVINFVVNKGRVFLPAAVRDTVPKPDLAAYSGFPDESEIDEIAWEQISPVLVCEVLVGGAVEKDLGRNVGLYLAVKSVKEYWVLLGSENPRQPSLIQHRRRGKTWAVTTFPYQSAFTTPLLPGFALTIDPRGGP